MEVAERTRNENQTIRTSNFTIKIVYKCNNHNLLYFQLDYLFLILFDVLYLFTSIDVCIIYVLTVPLVNLIVNIYSFNMVLNQVKQVLCNYYVIRNIFFCKTNGIYFIF